MSNTGKLAVLTVIENPLEWESRYRNYHRFRGMIESNGLCRLYMVEILHGKQVGLYHSLHTDSIHQVLQLRTDSQIWHKENAMNLLLQRVEEDRVAWIDADVTFTNTDWVHQVYKQLESYKVVQLFSHAQDLGYSFQPVGCVRPGYFYQYKTEGEIYGGINFWGKQAKKVPPERNAHPGLAFAATKETLSNLGGLIDWCIVGSGDFHMNAALLGKLTDIVTPLGYTENYIQKCGTWECLADEHVTRSVGYVPGLILHHWHGEKEKRNYATYQDILRKMEFNPDIDLVRDWQGLYKINNSNYKLEAAIKKYMRSRDDDSRGEVLIP